MRFFAAPLGHKVTALLLAIAVAGGLHTWFRHKAVQSSSAAELSFDSDAAQRINPAVAGGNQPAVTLAQSMLSDDMVAGLSKQAYLAAADMPGRITEFRSRVELTQPSAQVLDVRFRDPDPDKSTETANAVANALAAWTPSATPTPARIPAPAPAPKPVAAPSTPAPAPVKKPATVHHEEAGGALAAALSELEGQLSSTSRKVDGLDSHSSHYGGHSYGGYGRSSYAQSEQQQALKSGVRAALKKVDDLRAQYAKGDAGPGTKERLGAIREALSAVLSGGGGRYRAAGVSAGQLREERAQLTRAISVVAKQRQSIARDASAEAKTESDMAEQEPVAPAPAASAPVPAPVAPPVASTPHQDADAAPAATPSPSPSGGSAPEASVVGPSSPGPLRLLHLAGSPAPTLWWPSALAGLVCGLLYWSVAAWPSRAEDEMGYGDETVHSTARFITPDEPVMLRAEPPPAPPVPSPVGDEVFDRAVYKRASFSYEPPPSERYFATGTPAVSPERVVQEEVVATSAAVIGGVDADPPREQVDPAPVPAALEPTPAHEELTAVKPENHEPVFAMNPDPVSVSKNLEITRPIISPGSARVGENLEATPPRQISEPAPERETEFPTPREHLESTPVRENPEAARLTESVETAAPAVGLEAAPPPASLEAPPMRENVVEMADPWAELMKKALAETEIGRRFDGPPSRVEAAGKDKEQIPSRPDRMAG